MTIPAQYAKFLTALIAQALAFAQWKYGAGNEWVSLATGLAGALAVLAVPNAEKPAPPEVGWVGPRVPAPSQTVTPPPPFTTTPPPSA